MNRLIAHVLVPVGDRYLLVKRTAVERGRTNVYPEKWDVPGGLVQAGEMPQTAAVRECLEETGLTVTLQQIIAEDSHWDVQKQTTFTRLVYLSRLLTLPALKNLRLDLAEHSAWQLCSGEAMRAHGNIVVPYVLNAVHAAEFFIQ